MKIKEIVSQDRRDFTAIYECESCSKCVREYGYDDANFHANVIPKMKCPACGEISPTGARVLAPKYRESDVV